MNVSERVKQAYRNNSIHKNIQLYFPFLDLTVGNLQIHKESMTLTENLLEGDRVEFVGCIASSFRIKVNNVKENLKGQRMIVTIWTDETESEPITLFSGVVDSVKIESNKRNKEIIAYDDLYTIGNIDVSNWYNGLTFPITLEDLRDSLFHELGILQVSTTLPNDNVSITKLYDPKLLNALTVIKSICQINGAFGIINRDGFFEYRVPAWNINITPYPSITLYPSSNLFPAMPETRSATRTGDSDVDAEIFSFYRKVDFEEFSVKPVDKVTIRQSEDDAGVTYGSGTNNYIVQGNMFTKGLSNTVLTNIARGIYQSVHGIEFTPFTSSNNGLPWMECGIDAVAYKVYNYDYDPTRRTRANGNTQYVDKTFYVLNRTMTGIQALKDAYNAEGEEYQSEFITDLNANIETVKEKQNDTYTKEEIDTTFDDYDDHFDNIDTQMDDYDEHFSDIDTALSNVPVLVKVSVLPSVQEQMAHPNYWYFLEQ